MPGSLGQVHPEATSASAPWAAPISSSCGGEGDMKGETQA